MLKENEFALVLKATAIGKFVFEDDKQFNELVYPFIVQLTGQLDRFKEPIFNHGVLGVTSTRWFVCKPVCLTLKYLL